MIHRYAILALLLVPAIAGAQDHGSFRGTIVAQAELTWVNVPLPLAQQDVGTIDTHELSKQIGGVAILAVIAIIVIPAVRGKKPK
ncbi:MAG: hypothetical protein O3C40_12115 [Planctomycetota bacterium]|nr:hypothetical protein [Planctomycetota bacterium]